MLFTLTNILKRAIVFEFETSQIPSGFLVNMPYIKVVLLLSKHSILMDSACNFEVSSHFSFVSWQPANSSNGANRGCYKSREASAMNKSREEYVIHLEGVGNTGGG